MKDLAKTLVKARMPVRRRPRREDESAEPAPGEKRRRPRRLMEMMEKALPPKHSVYAELDSWEPRHRPSTEKELQSSRGAVPSNAPVVAQEATEVEVPETFSTKRMPAHKKRRAAMSICVSDEEAALLRKHVAGKGVNFSAWARGILFRAMGRKAPARPRQE